MQRCIFSVKIIPTVLWHLYYATNRSVGAVSGCNMLLNPRLRGAIQICVQTSLEAHSSILHLRESSPSSLRSSGLTYSPPSPVIVSSHTTGAICGTWAATRAKQLQAPLPFHKYPSLYCMDNTPEPGFLLCPSQHHPHLPREGRSQPVPDLWGHRVGLDVTELIFCVQ